MDLGAIFKGLIVITVVGVAISLVTGFGTMGYNFFIKGLENMVLGAVLLYRLKFKTGIPYLLGGLIQVTAITWAVLALLTLIMPKTGKKLLKIYHQLLAFPFVYPFRLIRRLANGRRRPGARPEEPAQVQKSPDDITLRTQSRSVKVPNVFRGVFVIGGAGSGKTESFAIPLISEFAKSDFTGILYDFKYPVLSQQVENFYTESRSPVRRFFLDFSNAKKSHRVNPLNPKYMPISAYAREYAGAIVKNLMKESIRKEDFWSRSATDLLTACIWYLKKHHPQHCDLPHTLALLQKNHVELVKLLVSDEEVKNMIISIATALETGAGEQVAGVVGSLQGAVAQINTPEFMFIFGGDDVDLKLNDPAAPAVLMVGSNPTIVNTLSPLCSLVISVATKMMNQPGRLPSFVMLDESPTVFIPNIEVIPNTGRSNKMATILFVQDLAQLTDGYGKEKADVLFASCGTHFYGRVSSSQTAEVLSKQFGKEDQTFVTKGNNTSYTLSGGSYSKSTSIQERSVVKPQDFMNLPVGRFVGRIAEGENMVTENFKMAKSNGHADISPKIPGYTDQEIHDYYRQVSETASRILKGGEGFYSASVDRENLIKKRLDEVDDPEEPDTEPVAEPGAEAEEKEFDFERIKAEFLMGKSDRGKRI